MKIAVLQMQPVAADIRANLEKIVQAAESASAMGADLLLAPELALSGYALGPRFADVAEPRDGDMVSALLDIAAEFELAICAGFPERDGSGIYNSAVLVRPDGSAECYRKTHLYGEAERAAFRAGDERPHVFDLCGIRTGMLVCYDVEFPENVRSLALAGAELVLVPTALPDGVISRRIADMVVPVRALENGVFVAYADLCGSEGEMRYGGRSVIVSPDGDEIARAGMGETLLIAEIDPDAYLEARRQNPYLTDRRPVIYRLD